jgi:hypothetical protein
MKGGFDFDVFISHASENKENFVRPLVEALTHESLTAWYDETTAALRRCRG